MHRRCAPAFYSFLLRKKVCKGPNNIILQDFISMELAFAIRGSLYSLSASSLESALGWKTWSSFPKCEVFLLPIRCLSLKLKRRRNYELDLQLIISLEKHCRRMSTHSLSSLAFLITSLPKSKKLLLLLCSLPCNLTATQENLTVVLVSFLVLSF